MFSDKRIFVEISVFCGFTQGVAEYEYDSTFCREWEFYCDALNCLDSEWDLYFDIILWSSSM